jgi:hypothetical protein
LAPRYPMFSCTALTNFPSSMNFLELFHVWTVLFIFFSFSKETGGIGTDASLGMFFYFMSAVAITRWF